MRYLTTSLLFLCSFSFTAGASFPGQPKNKAPGNFSLKDFSYLVGFKGGVNFSVVIPTQRFSVLQPIGGSSSGGEKDYSTFFSNIGYQYGFVGMVRLSPSLSLSIEPAFSSYAFSYESRSLWLDTADPTDRIEITATFTDRLKYFEIPVVLRYAFGSGQIRPFLAAGFFYGLLTGASGTARSTTVQYLDDAAVGSETSETAGDISGNYINTRLATFPGAGFFMDLSSVTLFVEADYYISLHNVVNESARYSNQLAVGGTYNVPDNLKLDNLVINLGILFSISSSSGKSSGQGRGKGSAVDCPTFKQKH
jgi:hypothetical protein